MSDLFVPGQHLLRYTREPEREPVAADRLIRWLYEDLHRTAPFLLRLLSRRWPTRLAAYLSFYAPWVKSKVEPFASANNISLKGLLGDPSEIRTRRDLFLRKLDYEKYRFCSADPAAVSSPADAKAVCGPLHDGTLAVKKKFFSLSEILGGRKEWIDRFHGGQYIIFRLAPPDYHWFHAPVSGCTSASYLLDGYYFSVNPRAVRSVSGLIGKNARHVVVIDTDVPDGSRVGAVAVIPVAAMVIGGITLSYSEAGYDRPVAVQEGLSMRRGQPMGYFAPGSSTVVMLFEKDRIEICPDLLQLQSREDGPVVYSETDFGRPLCEVALDARDTVAYRKGELPFNEIPIGRGMKLECRIKLWKLVRDERRSADADL